MDWRPAKKTNEETSLHWCTHRTGQTKNAVQWARLKLLVTWLDFYSLAHFLNDITTKVMWFGSTPVVRQIWSLLVHLWVGMWKIFLYHEMEGSFPRRLSPRDYKLGSSARYAGWRDTHAAIVVVFWSLAIIPAKPSFRLRLPIFCFP